MAGNYPDVPAPRMALDVDGTIGFHVLKAGGAITTLTGANMIALNDEGGNTSYGPVGTSWFGYIFPQFRDLSGVFMAANTVYSDIAQTSVDTTNGFDGTWVTALNPATSRANALTPLSPDYRANITALSSTNVKAFRWTGANNTVYALHLYGSISAGQTPDRLRMWHPTLDQPLDDATSADGAHLDWAEVTRSTTADRTFRVKNNSATLTANSIALTSSALTDATPSLPPQITYSDGGAFATTINIGNLTPGVISSLLTVRRTTSSTAALGLWNWRTIAEAGSWT